MVRSDSFLRFILLCCAAQNDLVIILIQDRGGIGDAVLHLCYLLGDITGGWGGPIPTEEGVGKGIIGTDIGEKAVIGENHKSGSIGQDIPSGDQSGVILQIE